MFLSCSYKAEDQLKHQITTKEVKSFQFEKYIYKSVTENKKVIITCVQYSENIIVYKLWISIQPFTSRVCFLFLKGFYMIKKPLKINSDTQYWKSIYVFLSNVQQYSAMDYIEHP